MGEPRLRTPDVKDVRTFPGLGLVGSLDGEAVAVGNLELMDELLNDLPDDVEEKIAVRAGAAPRSCWSPKANVCSAGWSSATAFVKPPKQRFAASSRRASRWSC